MSRTIPRDGSLPRASLPVAVALGAALVGLAACGADEPEAVEPETTATAGGTLSGDPQAGDDVDIEEQGAWPADPTPQELAALIQGRLRAAPSLADDTIVVRLEGSRVHLAGMVDSPVEIRIAHDLIADLPGVAQVYTDEMEVSLQ